jgi:hypothetical protein
MSWIVKCEVQISGVEDMITADNIGKELQIPLKEYSKKIVEKIGLSEKNINIISSKEIYR